MKKIRNFKNELLLLLLLFFPFSLRAKRNTRRKKELECIELQTSFFTFVCNLVFWVRTQFKHYGIFGVQIFLITKNVFGRQTSVVYLGRRTFKNLYV